MRLSYKGATLMKQSYTDHLGQTFPSLSAMAKHWGKSTSTLERRLHTMHLTVEQALTYTAEDCKQIRRQCQDHLGNTFASKRAMCEHYQIPSSIYFSRIRLGWSVQDALTIPTHLPAKNAKEVEDHLGQKFNSINAMCKHWGVARSTFMSHRKAGWSVKKALTTEHVALQTKQKVCKDHLGNEFPSQNAMCRHYGITRHILTGRLNLGWSLEDALTKPNIIASTIVKDYKNNQFPSLRDMAHYYHISERKLQGQNYDETRLTAILQSGFKPNTQVGTITVKKCIEFPYYEVEQNGNTFAMHFDLLLDTYHANFSPIPDRKITIPDLIVKDCITFPNYQVLYKNEPQIWSYWDIIWYIRDTNFGHSKKEKEISL